MGRGVQWITTQLQDGIQLVHWTTLWNQITISLNTRAQSTVVVHAWLPRQNVQAFWAAASKQLPKGTPHMAAFTYTFVSTNNLSLLFAAATASIHWVIIKWATSRQVPEQIGVIFVSFQIVSSDQIFDALLYCLEIRLQIHIQETAVS